jgi:hypothetical protein
MLCDEVIRELAVPTDDRDSAGLAEHLASCPSCAGWAERAVQLDRLWEATRSTEPSPETWDSVWAHLACSLDSSTPTGFEAFVLPIASSNGSVVKVEKPLKATPPSSRSRLRSLAAIGVLGLSQAAAIFIAVALSWHPSNGVEIEEGRLVVIRIDGSAAKVVDLTPERMSYSVTTMTRPTLQPIASTALDDWYLVFNAVEAIANPVVAMKE